MHGDAVKQSNLNLILSLERDDNALQVPGSDREEEAEEEGEVPCGQGYRT